jgi:phospho-N-acetylmuramoyl-pentapeptide-transferase
MLGDKAENFARMHAHKAWTPNMWWAMLLVVLAAMILLSLLLQHMGIINNSLITREETYITLFAFFSLWLLWLADDYFNIKWRGAIKWLSARTKIIWMTIIAAAMSRWFYVKLGANYVIFPWVGSVELGLFVPIVQFFVTLTIVNAINFTDWLDGLAGGLLIVVLAVLAIATFVSQLYIATAVLWIVIGVLIAFLWFNINPAKIFMGDGGAFALAWLISSLVYLLNMRMSIVVPFLLLFLLFWIEILSSAFQLFWKKVFKRKLFPIAPFHHLLEYRGWKEYTIVMKARLIQWVLATIALLMILYQFS